MEQRTRTSRRRRGALAAVSAAALAMTAAPAVASTADLPNGAELEATISTPSSGDTFVVPAGDSTVDVPLGGTASVGVGEPDTTWIYVIDVSGSTITFSCGSTTVLECEKQAVSNLHADVVASNSAVDEAVVIFGANATTADLSTAGGDQVLLPMGDPDFDGSVGSIYANNDGSPSGITDFTAKQVGSANTDYAEALAAALVPAQASSSGFINLVFLSDGDSNQAGVNFGTALSDLIDEGVTIYPFSVGMGVSCTGGANGTLQQMAVASDTECTEVPDPTDLPDIVDDLVSTELVSVEVTVDGGVVPSTTNPTVPADGPVTVDWEADALDLAPGSHEVCVTASGLGPASDPEATGSTTECSTFSVFAFDLQPPHAVNELGEDNSHTVTASVVGPAGELADWPVDFVVSDGPNAGTAGDCDPPACTTDASGEVTFTWTVPVESDSLGTDTVTATLDINGDTVELDATKLWEDTTPPVATCPAGPNPGGGIPAAPGNGGQGQNQDGFYELAATDDVWAQEDLEVFVRDTGSGTEWGPFEVGTDIKYTQAGGTPSIKPGSGDVEHRIKGTGDAAVYAVDGSGNVSEPVSCLVPRPPA